MQLGCEFAQARQDLPEARRAERGAGFCGDLQKRGGFEYLFRRQDYIGNGKFFHPVLRVFEAAETEFFATLVQGDGLVHPLDFGVNPLAVGGRGKFFERRAAKRGGQTLPQQVFERGEFQPFKRVLKHGQEQSSLSSPSLGSRGTG